MHEKKKKIHIRHHNYTLANTLVFCTISESSEVSVSDRATLPVCLLCIQVFFPPKAAVFTTVGAAEN